MTTTKWEVGTIYRTEGGFEARIDEIDDAAVEYALKGVLRTVHADGTRGQWRIMCWDRRGKLDIGPCPGAIFDLAEPVPA